MLANWLPLLALLGFVFVLGVVTWLRVRHAADTLEWATSTMDAPVRRVGALCVVASLGLTAALFAAGIEMEGAAAMAAVCGLGAWVALLGILGLEGALTEPESVAARRIAEGRPPPSSTRGRIVAVALGLAPILGAAAWMLLR